VSGGYIASGRCLLCERVFPFNPTLVPSVFVDPVSKRPPDVGEGGERRTPSADELARAVRLPLCPDCVVVVNFARKSHGMEPTAVLPGAYEPVAGLPG
jgi:hypothetical protein